MNICIATDGYSQNTGGIASFNQRLATMLINSGHTVIILFPDYESNSSEEDTILKDGDLIVVRLKKSYHLHYELWKPYFRPGGMDAASWIATGLCMRDWLMANHLKYKINIIEVSDYGGAGAFLSHSELPHVIITGHGSLSQLSNYQYEKQDEKFRLVKKLEMLAYEYADGIITHSPFNRENLQHLTGRQVHFAPMPWSDLHHTMESTIPHKIVVVAGLQPAKGIKQMLKAISLLKRDGYPVQVTWVGPDTWLAPNYQKMSVYLKNQYTDIWNSMFHWKGALDGQETIKEISSADIVVIPSDFDTFGYVAVEAAFHKKAIILTAQTGASYLFTHGTSAWILPSNDPNQLANAIIYLQNKPELRSLLGDNAFAKVSEVFIPEAIVMQRIAIYMAVISTRKGAESIPPFETVLRPFRNPLRKQYYCTRAFLKKILLKG